MHTNACLAIVIGCLSVANAQDMYCSGDLCFIRPDTTSGKSWMDAQQMCKDNNSTLPIANDTNSRISVINALGHFHLNGDVWLGAKASDNGYTNWRWLDGSQYSGTDVQNRGDYFKSYAYVAKATIFSEVLAYALQPNVSYSYICQCKDTNTDICTNGRGRTAFAQQNGCFVRYDEKLPWFNARNKCLENNCDLASFSQLSLLDGMVDSSSGGFWVGLRTSQWNWQNAVTGWTSDVTFTSWSVGQPNDAAPHCMATDFGDFPNWKDFDCTKVYSYICQVLDKSSYGTPTGPSSATIPTTSTSLSSTTASTTTTKSQFGTPGTESSSASSSTPPSSNTTEPAGLPSNNDGNRNSTNSVNVPLAIGLGVGLGVGFIIIIVVVVVVVAVVIPRKRRNSTESGNAKSTKKFVTNTSDENRDDGTTERSENKKKGRTLQDDSVGQYATVKSAYTDANIDYPSNTAATVYADLQFNPDEP